MDLNSIEASLNNSDFQYRLQAIAALKNYASDVAVPLLISKMRDPEFLVRSFVAMGLGKQKTSESYAALLEILRLDRDTNVKAEAANSLSLFGQVATSHLVSAFYQNSNWLIRRSILAALCDMDCPNELLEVCIEALKDEDLTVREAGVDAMAVLVGSRRQVDAVNQLLLLLNADSWRIRMHVARALKQFDLHQAKVGLSQLRQDTHHQVVAATLENLLP